MFCSLLGNEIGDEGCSYLAEALKGNTSITKLKYVGGSNEREKRRLRDFYTLTPSTLVLLFKDFIIILKLLVDALAIQFSCVCVLHRKERLLLHSPPTYFH